MTSIVAFPQKKKVPEVPESARRGTPKTAEKKDEPEEAKPRFQRIYLYMHLENITNLPEFQNDVVLRIEHTKNTITKLEDHYTADTSVNLTQLNAKKENVPTFSIMIDQDSIEELNEFSDNPVLLTLFEYIPPFMRRIEKSSSDYDIVKSPRNLKQSLSRASKDEEMELVEEQWIPKAQGCIDMLQFFTMQRNLKNLDVFIYPFNAYDTDFENGTCKLSWKIYSLFPLVKDVAYNNLVFLSLESIYNVKPEIFDQVELNFHVDLSFQSKILNESNTFDKVKICTFRAFKFEIIDCQKTYQKWASIGKDELQDMNNHGAEFGCKLDIYKIFKNLLWTEGTEFNFDDIDMEEESAMVYNSMHRYVLTNELCSILEDVIAFNQQHILFEFYRPEQPDNIILEGIIDLSIFLYPLA